jgi:DNA repair exonuclease SbcCD ATPase subunit
LYRCFEITSQSNLRKTISCTIHSDIVFVGAHFHKEAEIKLIGMDIHYSHLNEWARMTGFRQRKYTKTTPISISYKLPKPRVLGNFGDYKASIYVRAHHSMSGHREETIKEQTFIGIEARKEKTLDEFRKIERHLHNFLSLAVKHPVYPLLIEVKAKGKTLDIGGRKEYLPIDIHWKLDWTAYQKGERDLVHDEMLFTPEAAKPGLRRCMRNWFNKEKRLKPVYDLYFAILYNPRLYLEHRFLSAAQALETYHRRTMKNSQIDSKEHKKRVKNILKAAPPEFKDWLEQKLEYSNEPSLRRRLREIISANAEPMKLFIKDEKGFIQKVWVTRNYLTHYDPKLEGAAVKDNELYEITEKLRRMIEICFLKELGFDSIMMKDLVK